MYLYIYIYIYIYIEIEKKIMEAILQFNFQNSFSQKN